MTDQQENRLSRNEKVNAFLIKNKNGLAAIPAISATLQPQLAAIIKKMRDDDEHAVQDNTGYGDNKEDIEGKLENMADHVGSGLESYADDKDDFILMNSVEFTLSQIQGFRDNRLLQYAQFVFGKASDKMIQPVLISDHNITADDITTLGTLIESYETASPLPQQMKGESVAWGKQVDRDLAEADKILVRIRRKMNTFRTTNTLLFDAFTAVDSIDDTGSHKGKDETIAGGATFSVGSFAYEAGKTFSLQNTGSGNLQLAMFKDGIQTGTPLLVSPGVKAVGTLSDLGTEGDELKIINKSTGAGSYIFTM